MYLVLGSRYQVHRWTRLDVSLQLILQKGYQLVSSNAAPGKEIEVCVWPKRTLVNARPMR